MIEDKDISEVIEEEAAALEAADDSVETPPVEEVETEDVTAKDTAAEDATVEDTTEDPEAPPADAEAASSAEAVQAPEHWAEEIRSAFDKADPATQQVWLDQQKEFQRGFNNVAQEAAQLRRYQQDNIGVQKVLDQVIPSWQAQGMTAEQGLGQLVQLGMAYASNPQQTLIHLAEMAGLDLNTLGEDAPYRTSDDIARDARLQEFESRLAEQDKRLAQERQTQLESEINAFQAETDTDGSLKHPYFAESMDDIASLFRSGFTGTLEQAYEQVVWTNPETRAKMVASIPANKVPQTDQSRTAAAEKAQAASSQRVKQARPAPETNAEMDDLSDDDLVARVAAQMEARG
jgi:hypothetical protein